jgi:sugar phosphate isomerase/epimerase
MLKTRTGGFPIGFRRGWSDWQKDLSSVLDWASSQGMSVVDLGRDGDQSARIARDSGFTIGSVDLAEWQPMISADGSKRRAAVQRNAEYIEACAAASAHNHFVVMLPEDPSLPRSENFGYMVDSLNELSTFLEKHGSRLVIEGWPGPGALCCTPEGYRACFAQCPSPSIGVNYDPSHLVRMGIDPIRFAEEFKDRVYHVHGKDTELVDEALYEFGTEQPATFANAHGFGSHHWRYTIPGHGCIRWSRAFQILADNGYRGAVSIELEDEDFNGSEAGEKQGLVLGAGFLSGC